MQRRAHALMGNIADAEDVTQEVFIKAIDAPEIEGPEMMAWLYRVTTNACLDTLRTRKRRRELTNRVMKPLLSDTHEDATDAALTLRWLLSNAEPRQAQVAIYIHVDGLTAAEAGEMVGVSRRTAFNLLERFRVWAHAQTDALRAANTTKFIPPPSKAWMYGAAISTA